MSNSLFENFPSVSAKQWKQKIQFDLKGLDYNQTLLTNTDEGIVIKPFYHKDDFNQLEISDVPSNFEVCQTIYINNVKSANYLAIDALNRGADVVKFIAGTPFEFDKLLEGLVSEPSKKPLKIYFYFLFLNESFLKKLTDFIKNKQIFLNVDIIGNLTKNGNWFYNHKKDHQILKSVLEKSDNTCSIFGVDVGHYQNSGANIVQQVAYALAHANEYLNHFGKNVGSSINFNFSVGGNYFFEIAKLRAFKYLWQLLIQDYNYNIKANIFSEPSLRNKSIYDYNCNMLRTTSECMSAILGGTNAISNVSYDAIFHRKNEFGERIARNQLTILREESYFKNADFVKGSYYIEQLTYEICEKALTLFKSIEKSGGFVKQLFEGIIQRKIEESAWKEQNCFDKNESVMIGINKYMMEEKMKDQIELFPFLKSRSHETILHPIIAKRLADRIEKERLTDESNGKLNN